MAPFFFTSSRTKKMVSQPPKIIHQEKKAILCPKPIPRWARIDGNDLNKWWRRDLVIAFFFWGPIDLQKAKANFCTKKTRTRRRIKRCSHYLFIALAVCARRIKNKKEKKTLYELISSTLTSLVNLKLSQTKTWHLLLKYMRKCGKDVC